MNQTFTFADRLKSAMEQINTIFQEPAALIHLMPEFLFQKID